MPEQAVDAAPHGRARGSRWTGPPRTSSRSGGRRPATRGARASQAHAEGDRESAAATRRRSGGARASSSGARRGGRRPELRQRVLAEQRALVVRGHGREARAHPGADVRGGQVHEAREVEEPPPAEFDRPLVGRELVRRAGHAHGRGRRLGQERRQEEDDAADPEERRDRPEGAAEREREHRAAGEATTHAPASLRPSTRRGEGRALPGAAVAW